MVPEVGLDLIDLTQGVAIEDVVYGIPVEASGEAWQYQRVSNPVEGEEGGYDVASWRYLKRRLARFKSQ